MKLYIHYWDHNKELCIEFSKNGLDHLILIKNGRVEFEVECEYMGSSNIYFEFLLYDLCGLMALWQETYGRLDDYV